MQEDLGRAVTSRPFDEVAVPIVRIAFHGRPRRRDASRAAARWSRFTCGGTSFDRLPYLSPDVTPQGIAGLADVYRDVLRRFLPSGTGGRGNGCERLVKQPFELRITASRRRRWWQIADPALRSRELILYGDVDLMGRTAIVRSLRRTEGYVASTSSFSRRRPAG